MASSSYAPLILRGEQSETLAYPVQESGTNNVEDSGGRPPSPPCICRQPEEVLYFSTSLATWALQPTTASNNCYCVYE